MQSPLRDRNGEVVGVLDIVRDITEAKHAEDQLQLAATVYKSIGEAIVVADAENKIIAVNPAFTSLTGYDEQEVIGRNTNLLRSGKHSESFYRDMWLGLETTGHWQGEIWNRHKNGEICQEWLVITTVYGDDGSVEKRIGMLSSVTDQKRTAQSIWQQASFDPLTGLPNRRLLHNRLEQEVKKAHRGGESFALLYLDLDGFKEINDTLGHDKGDLLLKEVAQRLLCCVRESDTVARLGGDEFTIILIEIEDQSSIERVAQCLLSSLIEPFSLGEDRANISASIGITLYPDDARGVNDLLKSADKAMYAAKKGGRNTFCYFTDV
jgi:diguanylate cyclase (GGDEF)-like protein/PAS domain S-box-containing protein